MPSIVSQNTRPKYASYNDYFSLSQWPEPRIAEPTTKIKLRVTNLEHNDDDDDDDSVDVDLHANPNGLSSLKHKVSTTSTSTSASSCSLALCTEHLGSETGSDDAVAGELPSTPSGSGAVTSREGKKRSGTAIRGAAFPPPLTTMGSLQLRMRREDGRLIVETTTSTGACLHAERGDGRLRLCYLGTSTGEVEGDREERGEETTKEEEIDEPRSGIESKRGGECDGEASMEMGVSSEKHQWWSTSRCKEEEGGGSRHGSHLFVGWPLPGY